MDVVGRIVLKPTDTLQAGVSVFVERLSEMLIDTLLARKIYVTGNVQCTNVQFLTDNFFVLQKSRISSHEMLVSEGNKVVAIKLFDSTPIRVASSKFRVEPRVDLMDWDISKYSMSSRTRREWRRVRKMLGNFEVK